MAQPPIGLTDYVSPEVERERIRTTLYRADASARGVVAAACSPTWSERELALYREDGYLAMEGVLSADEIASAKAALSDLARRGPTGDGVEFQEEPYYSAGGRDDRVGDPELRVRVIRNYCDAEPRLAALAAHPHVRRLVDALIGEGHALLQATALLKPAYHGAEKPWHQDAAYFDQWPIDGVVGVWIALDRATVENGCMQLVPGTHRGGPVRHYHLRDCQIEDARVAVERAVVVPLAPGGALFFSALLHHGTPPNSGPERRRALQFHYKAAQCRTQSFDEHAALFDDDGAYAGCRVWELGPDRPRATPGGTRSCAVPGAGPQRLPARGRP
jgi:phytanoyl-CoA hydroxylase